MLDHPEKYEDNIKIIQEAHIRRNWTNKYCGDDCENPKFLEFGSRINLNDGVKKIDGSIFELNRNPSKLLKDQYLKDWFKICRLCEMFKTLPHSGGVLDQTNEFIEMFEIYSFWLKYAQDKEKSHQ